jgi:predicted transcriptional regulator
MLMHISIKVPPEMKAALEKQAEREFTSVSGLLKKAAEQYLQANGVDWRQEKEK